MNDCCLWQRLKSSQPNGLLSARIGVVRLQAYFDASIAVIKQVSLKDIAFKTSK